MSRDMKNVMRAGEWLSAHLTIQEYFDQLNMGHFRGGLVAGVTEDACQTVIDCASEDIDFTAADLKEAWDKNYYSKFFRKHFARTYAAGSQLRYGI